MQDVSRFRSLPLVGVFLAVAGGGTLDCGLISPHAAIILNEL